jgi:hypothetical protein
MSTVTITEPQGRSEARGILVDGVEIGRVTDSVFGGFYAYRTFSGCTIPVSDDEPRMGVALRPRTIDTFEDAARILMRDYIAHQRAQRRNV